MYRQQLLIFSIVLIISGFIIGEIAGSNDIAVVGTIIFWIGVLLLAIWVVLFVASVVPNLDK